MPTYEYLCRTCSHRFETWQKMTDEPLTICPECGGHIRRVLYPTGIVFKGSGFYKTDHGSVAGSNGHAAKGEGESTPAETKTASEGKSTESTSGNSSKSTSENKVPTGTK